MNPLPPPRPDVALLLHARPEFSEFLTKQVPAPSYYFLPRHRGNALGNISARNRPSSVRVRTFPVEAFLHAFRFRFDTRRKVVPYAAIHAARVFAHAYVGALPRTRGMLYVDQEFLSVFQLCGLLKHDPYTILATRLPFHAFHERLDAAARLHPEAISLREFRAPKILSDAEAEAFQGTPWIVTAHPEIAKIFPKSQRLPWSAPSAPKSKDDIEMPRERNLILFPGPTAAREGCLEVRQVALELGLAVGALGPTIESTRFWDGVPHLMLRRNAIPWDRVRMVVHPTLFEAFPRLHLQALSMGIPVVASCGTGLSSHGAVEVPFGDSAALKRAVEEALRS